MLPTPRYRRYTALGILSAESAPSKLESVAYRPEM